MGTIWIREFTGGLDARRLPEASSGALLIKAQDGHITRGGEFEQRAAFVRFAAAPDTYGLAYTPESIVVFGSDPEPLGLPAGVIYQRLEHPEGYDIVRVRSHDLYAGKLYVAAEFDDGNISHFYDGEYVEFWFDGRARASFQATAAVYTPGGQGYGSCSVTTCLISETIPVTNIVVNGVQLLAGTLTFMSGTSGEETRRTNFAKAIVDAINANSGVSGFTAIRYGYNFDVLTVAETTLFNGQTIAFAYDNSKATITNDTIEGGRNPIPPRVTNVIVNGVSTLSVPIDYPGTFDALASALAAAINAQSGTTGYSATSNGPLVTLAAVDPGADRNGQFVSVQSSGFTFSPTTVVTAGGQSNDVQPGAFVKTIAKKMYSAAGPSLYFSAIGDPTQWTTANVGAGFIDMSTESSGSEALLAVAKYQQLIAVFSETVIQIWYVDPDPALNRQSQVLSNTGTISGLSVTQFGDNDLFYLDESGIRSLRARDSSNAASTTDIGVPIDPLVIAQLETMTSDEKSKILGLIEPRDGRFWLIMKDKIFVFSFFGGAKISAWSTYTPSIVGEDNEPVILDITDVTVFQKRVYVRAEDTIYVYGGLGATQTFDATVAEAWLPYVDADAPMKSKEFNSLDVIVRGQWETAIGLDPNEIEVEQNVAMVGDTTYAQGRIPINMQAHHMSLRFRSTGVGPHKLAAVSINFDGDAGED